MKNPANRLSKIAFSKVFVLAGITSLHAQVVAPSPVDTSYTDGGDGLWRTLGNWNNGVPTASDNALINSGQTALWEQNVDGDPAFGTLTIGENATLQFRANNNQGLPTDSQIYFSNGSHLQYTGGTSNRDDDFYILPGASAKVTARNRTFMRGTLTGSGSLEYVLGGNFDYLELRRDVTDAANNLTYTGDMTFTNGGFRSSQFVWLRQFGKFAKNRRKLGSGVNTFGDGVYIRQDNNEYIDDAGTLKLVGGSGDANQYKYALGADRRERFANLIFDSPKAARAHLRSHNGFFTVTNSVLFEGTAGTVEIDSRYGAGRTPTSSQWAGGLDADDADITFSGTGDWTVTGNGLLRLNNATVTTNANATITNPLSAPNGFTKEGSGTLTLTGGAGPATSVGNITVNAGELAITGTVDQITVNAGAELTIGSSDSASDVLTIGSGGLTIGDNATINFQFDENGNDMIVSSETLDLTGLTSLTINGTALNGFEASYGQEFVLFDGDVTGFDASIFTLNMPDLPVPEFGDPWNWYIREGSLVLGVIPEPSSLLLSGFGLLGLLMRRRRA